jgi:arsenite methyltransferase
MTTLEFDADASRRVEAAYVTADVIEQRRIVMGMLEPALGEHVLDIGVGPGLLAAEIAAAVGPEGAVSGIDLSETMLAMAATRAERDGSARIELRIAGAEELPYPDATFDAVVSTQVFEYVPDVPRAISEIWRVLKPGGRVLLLDSDWDSIVWRSSDNARMQHVLTLWAEHLVDPFLPRTLRDTLAHSGFDAARPVIVPIFNVGFDENTFSAILIGLVSQFVNGRGDLTPADLDAWADDLRSLGDGYFFSLNRYVFLANKPA